MNETDFIKIVAGHPVNRGFGFLYSATDAIKAIAEAKRQGLPILGIDAFWVGQIDVQPSLEHSADYTVGSYAKNPPANIYEHAMRLIEKNSSLGFFFELVIDFDVH